MKKFSFDIEKTYILSLIKIYRFLWEISLIVTTIVFLSKRKENCHYNRIPFKKKGKLSLQSYSFQFEMNQTYIYLNIYINWEIFQVFIKWLFILNCRQGSSFSESSVQSEVFKIFHWNWMNSNPWCIISQAEYDDSDVFFRNSEYEEIFYQNLICPGTSYFV